MLELVDCKHQFCKECLIQYLDNLISSRQVTKLICPSYGCGMKLKYSFLEEILTAETLEKYSQFKEELDMMVGSKRAYCPRPKCSKLIEVGDRKTSK